MGKNVYFSKTDMRRYLGKYVKKTIKNWTSDLEGPIIVKYELNAELNYLVKGGN